MKELLHAVSSIKKKSTMDVDFVAACEDGVSVISQRR